MKTLAGSILLALVALMSFACQPQPDKNGTPADATTLPATKAPGAKAPGPRAPSSTQEVAILAGGCFWGMEEIIRGIDGVIDTDVGYSGGSVAKPSYEDVKKGTSGHAESVRVVFDPSKLSYEDLLAKWFFKMHDPTTKNRQGNDIGSQYRSAIFVTSDAQRRVAQAVKKRIDERGVYDKPIVTEIVDAGPFTTAEGYHQDYLQNTPNGYTCHFLRGWEDDSI
jgi:peptide methionine sulfoxide reductase msrA/msrB